MPVTNTNVRNDYIGNGSTTDFPYTFDIFDNNEIFVYLNSVLQTVGFTILPNLVRFTVPPGNTVKVLLLRRTPRTQSTDWVENDNDPAQAKEDAFDRSMHVDQEQDEILSRSPHYNAPDIILSNAVIDPPVVGAFAQAKDINGNIGWATLTPQGVLTNPVSFTQGGTGGSYANALALLQGINAALWRQGADVIAASTLPLANPLDGNLIRVTGNTTITALNTVGINVGTVIRLLFTGVPLITNGASLILLDGQNYQVVANDIMEFQLYPGPVWRETTPIGGTNRIFSKPEATRLMFISGTSLKLNPFKGRLIPVKTGGIWRLRDISASGVTSGNPTTTSNFVNGVSSQLLTASTSYLVCVFDNSGTLTFDFISILTHTQDADTGVEIKNGDPTRTVVGEIVTDASRNFSDFLTISWFNRRRKSRTTAFTAGRQIMNGTYVEIHSEIENGFLSWNDEAVYVFASGGVENSVVGVQQLTSFGFDSIIAEDVHNRFVQPASGGGALGMTLVRTGLPEGFHFVTLLGAVGGGIGTWVGGTASLRTTLVVSVQG